MNVYVKLIVVAGWCLFLYHFGVSQKPNYGCQIFLSTLLPGYNRFHTGTSTFFIQCCIQIARKWEQQFCYLNTGIHAIWDSLWYPGHWYLASRCMTYERPLGHLWATGNRGRLLRCICLSLSRQLNLAEFSNWNLCFYSVGIHIWVRCWQSHWSRWRFDLQSQQSLQCYSKKLEIDK